MTRGYDTPVELLSAPVVSASYGVQARDWDSASVTAVAAWVGPVAVAGGEEQQSASAVTAVMQVNLPPSVVVSAQDRVRVAGDVFEVDGEPRVAFRRGVVHHREVTLRRVEFGG